jgi:hypothetical protein
MNWTEFNKKVMERTFEIVNGSRAVCFKLMGYRFLYKRLILYYDDCKEVYIFRLINVDRKNGEEEKGEYEETKFFTKSYDWVKATNEFAIEAKKEDLEKDEK